MNRKTHNTLRAFSLSALVLSSQAMGTLISYWPMDNTDGTVATATFGKDAEWQNVAGDGTATNLTWITDGIFAGAAQLGGQVGGNNYFNADLNGQLINAEALTISMWVNPDGATGNYEGLFMTRPSNPGPTLDDGFDTFAAGNWGLAWRPGQEDRFELRIEGVAITDQASSPSDDDDMASDANGWYHIAGVWDDANGEGIVYVNGTAVQTTSVSVFANLSGGIFHIGNDSATGDRDFQGRIDDVAVWDTALTPEQITSLFDKSMMPDGIDPPADPDNDGIPSAWENQFPGFLDPNVNDAAVDGDREGGDIAGALMPDGLTNLQEFQLDTDPTNPDTDADGLLDGQEVNGFDFMGETITTNPRNNDGDGDGLLDGEEANGITISGVTYITDPRSIDTDGDTIRDSEEIVKDQNGDFTFVSDPNDPLDPPIPDLPIDGLVALYQFDETSGTTATDTANMNDDSQDGTLGEGTVAWTTEGQIGGALRLDGNTFLTAQDALAEGTPAFTLTAWLRPTVQGTYRGVFATRALNPGPDDPNLNWGLNVESNPLNADIRFPLINGASNGINVNNIPLNEWTHLAMSWETDVTDVLDETFGFATGTVYLNGIKVEELDTDDRINGTSIIDYYRSSGIWYIGTDPAEAARRFSGDIDEVSVWNIKLSDEQVSAIFRRGQNGEGIAPQFTPPPAPPEITDVTFNADGTVASVSFNSETGATYSVYVRDTLDITTDPGATSRYQDWNQIANDVAGADGTTTFPVPAGSFGAPTPAKGFLVVERNPQAQQ